MAHVVERIKDGISDQALIHQSGTKCCCTSGKVLTFYCHDGKKNSVHHDFPQACENLPAGTVIGLCGNSMCQYNDPDGSSDYLVGCCIVHRGKVIHGWIHASDAEHCMKFSGNPLTKAGLSGELPLSLLHNLGSAQHVLAEFGIANQPLGSAQSALARINGNLGSAQSALANLGADAPATTGITDKQFGFWTFVGGVAGALLVGAGIGWALPKHAK